MSTIAQVGTLVEKPRPISLVVTKPIPDATGKQSIEAHPLVLVFIAAFIAFNLSIGMIGSILMWLSLRHSGVMAP